jgi:hypothetical protein
VQDFSSTHIILVLGYPEVDIDDKIKEERMYAKDSRTGEIMDSELREDIILFIELSRLYQQICLAHKIPFINTSKNFE